MIGGDASPGSRQRRLEVDCALADVLFERSTIDLTRRGHEALSLLEESPLPTAVFDAATRTPRLLNAAWRARFGALDAYKMVPGVDEAVRTGVTMHVPELALELDSRFAYYAATVRASGDELRATATVIIVCVDITDEVIARQLGVDADALVWGGPIEGDPDYFNRRWSTFAETHSTWQHAVHPGDLTKCNENLRWVIRARGSTDIEVRLCRADGEYRWHRVRFALASSGARWFGTASDIHDAHEAAFARDELLARERAARADVERANRLKDQFLATVSHELRTPLTTIVMWEGILRSEHHDPKLRAKALDAIRQSVDVQSRVVGDLLDVSRAIAGKLHVDLRPVDLEQVIVGALDSVAGLVKEKQIVLERRGTQPSGTVNGDAARLRQVLVNLLTNAVKFTDRGGCVTIAASRRGRSITIEVEDNGRGIAPELLPHIFEPFRQTDNSPLNWESGLGIGLTIAKQLVELHHGTITASSPGLGQGTKLSLVLPAARRSATPRHGVPRRVGLERMRVLVVDDDERLRDALTVLLDRAGAVVESAESAAVARTLIARCAPDALVCDIAMPGEDGYAFIRGLRAGGGDVAAIALTASATEADAGRALAAGFDRHLGKPVDFERLASTIAEVIVAHRARSGQRGKTPTA